MAAFALLAVAAAICGSSAFQQQRQPAEANTGLATPPTSSDGGAVNLVASNHSVRGKLYREVRVAGQWYPCWLLGPGKIDDTYNIKTAFLPNDPTQEFSNVPASRLRNISGLQFAESTKRIKAESTEAVQRVPVMLRNMAKMSSRSADERAQLKEQSRLRKQARLAAVVPNASNEAQLWVRPM
eukprot:CAMPEP_0171089766 /NCGR_PEP_ID=MMETSP0766_2-20121228/27324_1 /TAXON_ID=439317 /ORGANISM="Gambierdiscus australes, Strain CAWD 149" /LENGTH=182 /DNA_ID=CAMNT_0011547673 /DNA_START=69 /DNA_END=617 /DNA_ORIENTATION=+